jgi:hypothetical protein
MCGYSAVIGDCTTGKCWCTSILHYYNTICATPTRCLGAVQSATPAAASIGQCSYTITTTTTTCTPYTPWAATIWALVSIPTTTSTTHSESQQGNARAASTACV